MQLKVTYEYTDPANNIQGYKLKATAVGTGMSSKVFVCQRRVPSATDSEYNELPDEFVSLADPVDLEQYPEDEPNLGDNIPYYRVDSITLVFRSAPELEEVRLLLDEDIQHLLTSLEAMDDIISGEVIYGG